MMQRRRTACERCSLLALTFALAACGTTSATHEQDGAETVADASTDSATSDTGGGDGDAADVADAATETDAVIVDVVEADAAVDVAGDSADVQDGDSTDMADAATQSDVLDADLLDADAPDSSPVDAAQLDSNPADTSPIGTLANPNLWLGGAAENGSGFVDWSAGGAVSDLVTGLQGGQHLWVVARAKAVNPKKAKISVLLTDLASDEEVAPGKTEWYFTLQPIAGGWLQSPAITAFVTKPCASAAKTLRVDVTVLDQDGVTQQAEAKVQTQWPGSCP